MVTNGQTLIRLIQVFLLPWCIAKYLIDVPRIFFVLNRGQGGGGGGIMLKVSLWMARVIWCRVKCNFPHWFLLIARRVATIGNWFYEKVPKLIASLIIFFVWRWCCVWLAPQGLVVQRLFRERNQGRHYFLSSSYFLVYIHTEEGYLRIFLLNTSETDFLASLLLILLACVGKTPVAPHVLNEITIIQSGTTSGGIKIYGKYMRFSCLITSFLQLLKYYSW